MASSALIEEVPQHLYNAQIPRVAHEHLWIVMAAYRVNPLAPRPWLMGVDNLVTADGPGCFFCEADYTPEVASRPCPGEAGA